jgi:hypothetical protein
MPSPNVRKAKPCSEHPSLDQTRPNQTLPSRQAEISLVCPRAPARLASLRGLKWREVGPGRFTRGKERAGQEEATRNTINVSYAQSKPQEMNDPRQGCKPFNHVS